ncbi:MAG TPA: alanine racemase [Verrucomicrobiae bacterium]
MKALPQYRCWAEVDFNALRGNLAWIRHRVGPEVKIMTVVKADAYGHGLKQIAALLMQSGTDIFGVANLAEAQAIRAVGRGWPILMLGACLPHEVEAAIRDQVMVTISSLAEARAFSKAAARLGKAAQVHLKIDTGMGRLGARPEEAKRLLAKMEKLPGLAIKGIYTHYACAEDDKVVSKRQGDIFLQTLKDLRISERKIEFVHANNSAALILEPRTIFNTVRPGLLVYGIVPQGRRHISDEISGQLRPALSWKCRVSLVKEIPKNFSLSYGGSFVSKRAMRVATLTAGYGDGYLRAGSNRAQVLIRGRRCPLLGRVTMDQILIDVSQVARVESGDEAVLIGRQGADEISATELASWLGTIAWEILTNITYRVPRLYLGGHAA